MKSKILFPVILAAGFLMFNFSGLTVYGQSAQKKEVKQQEVKYTCPMHSEVSMAEPGNCSKCGMNLVKNEEMLKKDLEQVTDTTPEGLDPMIKEPDTTMIPKKTMKPKTKSIQMVERHTVADTTGKKPDKK